MAAVSQPKGAHRRSASVEVADLVGPAPDGTDDGMQKMAKDGVLGLVVVLTAVVVWERRPNK